MLLHKYILKSHIIPFVFSLLTLFCIFLLQFLMKFADRLVGKGLDAWVIIQLIVYNLSWMVALVVPMATLVATLMAFGNLSQNNEITIMKSSGVSLYKMMTAPLIASIIVGYLLVLFNDDVLPDANHQAKLLMQDISRKKPTLSLEPGIFSQEVSNYAILVRDINPKSNDLKQVTIYDYTSPRKVNVVTAEKGKIFFSKDYTKLIMDLENGEIHESDLNEPNFYRKLIFDNHRITMNAEQFSFQQTTPGGYRGERELSIDDMLAIVDSLTKRRDDYYVLLKNEVQRQMFPNTSLPAVSETQKSSVQGKAFLSLRLKEKVRTAKNNIISNQKRIEYVQIEINKYMVEVHKKYSIPAACIVFILIGAPLGVMVKKGGFGVAASISLFFFLLYWAFLIGGEKLADRGFFAPFWGMWSANILLAIAGILITIKSVRETVTLNFSFLKKFIPKQFKNEEEKQADEDIR
jgi:lipopolysaccharide export system permease protein